MLTPSACQGMGGMRTVEAGLGPIETSKPKRSRLDGGGADECTTQRRAEGIHAALVDPLPLNVMLLQQR